MIQNEKIRVRIFYIHKQTGQISWSYANDWIEAFIKMKSPPTNHTYLCTDADLYLETRERK